MSEYLTNGYVASNDATIEIFSSSTGEVIVANMDELRGTLFHIFRHREQEISLKS